MKRLIFKKKGINRRIFLFGILIIVLLVIGSVVFVFFQKNKKVSEDLKLIAKMQKIIGFSEKPEITTITAQSMLDRNPDFLKDAKLGDKIFTFENGALVFDPKTKKILNIVSNGTLFKEEFKSLKIALRYNEGQEERMMEFKNSIEESLPQIVFIETSLSEVEYQGDVVYLVNKRRIKDAYRFANSIGSSPLVEELEQGEKITNADIIVAFSNQDSE